MSLSNADKIREQVKKGYGAVASRAMSTLCCGDSGFSKDAHAEHLGYSAQERAQIPEEANMGLGCGNPTAIAAIQPGEVVLDLGSGAGMDAFLAAHQVGPSGRVVGVDMTPEMLEVARRNASKQGVDGYVEFREGLIEDLPVESQSVDVVLSNCVINLSTDKRKVFQEAFRVLQPGGRLAVSDILLTHPLPDIVREQASMYMACISGAMQAPDYLALIEEAGFENVRWTRTSAAPILESACDDPLFAEARNAVPKEQHEEILHAIWSYRIEATRPCTPSPRN